MEDKIRAAYDQMDPTPEQEKRMLEALMAAQANMQEESGGTPGSEPASAVKAVPGGRIAEPSAKRTGMKPWKIALPIAACLAVVAVLVGVTAIGPMGTNATQASTTAARVESASSSAANVTGDAQAPSEGRSSAAAAPDAATEIVNDSALGYEAEGYAPKGDSTAGAVDDAQPPFNTEEYAATDENGFVSTRTSPLSTLSADVDTASYCNVRRMLRQGTPIGSIPSGAVRTEEMLNYFTYDYAEPTGDDKFAIQAQASTCPWNADTQLLVLGFSTAREKEAANKGANLVFLIDVSGSMNSRDKLDLLKESFATLVKSLDSRDRVSIVTYSGSEAVVLEGASGDDDKRILEAINGLRANGSTNGEAGLRMAYDVAERNFIEGGVNRIVMASDGDLNVGMTSESDLYDFVDGKRQTGVYLSVLGFGTGNYKDTKMEVLADHGNGSYHYIDCTEEAERVLSEKLMANLVPFADDVKVQVEFNPAQVKAYRLIGYENRALADEAFTDDTVDAGDVGPNAQFTVAYEIMLADSPYEVAQTPDLKYGPDAYAGSSSSDWLTCSLRYRAFSDNELHEQSLVVNEGDSTGKPSDDWTFAAAVIEFAMVVNQSDYLGTAHLNKAKTMIEGTNPNDERKGLIELIDLAMSHSDGGDNVIVEDAEQRNGFDRDPL